MPAAKGFRPPAAGIGRKKGVQNKITRSVKAALEAAFLDAQADPKSASNLKNFREESPREFIMACSKLIPQDIKASVSGNLVVTPNVNLIVEAMGCKVKGGLKPSGAITVTTEPQGVNGRKPD